MRHGQFALVTAVAVGVASIAFAADMPIKAPVYKGPAAVAAYSWTGWYAGINGGYTWGHASTQFTQLGATFPAIPANIAAVNAAGSGGLNPQGGTFGGQLGFNWQMHQWVYGIETDINWIGVHKTSTVTQPYPAFPANFTVNRSISADYLYTLRGRVGFTPWDRTFVYGTGGLAVTSIHYTSAFTDTSGFGPNEAFNVRQTKAGYVLGAGVEHAYGNKWTLKVEYLRSEFSGVSGNNTFTTPVGATTATYANSSGRLSMDTVRAGVNHKF